MELSRARVKADQLCVATKSDRDAALALGPALGAALILHFALHLALGFALAFVKIEGITLPRYLTSLLSFSFKPQKYLWRKKQ